MKRIRNSNLKLEDVMQQFVSVVVNQQVSNTDIQDSKSLDVKKKSVQASVTEVQNEESVFFTTICQDVDGNVYNITNKNNTRLVPVVGADVYIDFIDNEPYITSLNRSQLNINSSQGDFRISADGNINIVSDGFMSMVSEKEISINSGNGTDITLNGSVYGGLIKIDELTSKLNNLVSEVNSLKNYISTHIHTCASPGSPTTTPVTPPTTTFSQFKKTDYENGSVEHGDVSEE